MVFYFVVTFFGRTVGVRFAIADDFSVVETAFEGKRFS